MKTREIDYGLIIVLFVLFVAIFALFSNSFSFSDLSNEDAIAGKGWAQAQSSKNLNSRFSDVNSRVGVNSRSYKTLIPEKIQPIEVQSIDYTKKVSFNNFENFENAFSNMGLDYSTWDIVELFKWSYFINQKLTPQQADVFYDYMFISNNEDDLIDQINKLNFDSINEINKFAWLSEAEKRIKLDFFGTEDVMINWKDSTQMVVNVGDISSIVQSEDSEKTSGAPVGSQGDPITSSNEIDVGSVLGNMFDACMGSGGEISFDVLPQAPTSSSSLVGTTTTEDSNIQLGEAGMSPNFNPTAPPLEDCKLSPLNTGGSVGQSGTDSDADYSPWGGGGEGDQGPPAPGNTDGGTDGGTGGGTDGGTGDDTGGGTDGGTGDDTGGGDDSTEGELSLSDILPAGFGVSDKSNFAGGGTVNWHDDSGHGAYFEASISKGVAAGGGYSFRFYPDPSSDAEIGAQVDQCGEMACFFLEAIAPQVDKDKEYFDCISGVLSDSLTTDNGIAPVSLTTEDFSNSCGNLGAEGLNGPFAEAFTDPAPFSNVEVIYTFSTGLQEETQQN